MEIMHWKFINVRIRILDFELKHIGLNRFGQTCIGINTLDKNIQWTILSNVKLKLKHCYLYTRN